VGHPASPERSQMVIDNCLGCGGPIDAGAVACPSCGVAVHRELPPFFAVSLLKSAVMSFFTLGLYELYWFYRNWQRVRVRENRDIKPSLRTLFALIFCYPCFREIRKTGLQIEAIATPPMEVLAAGWTVMWLAFQLPKPGWMIAIFSWVFMVPVQAYANQINLTAVPGHDRNSQFTVWNWVGICLGALAILSNLVALWRIDAPR
jgi:hypothetical protein